jgi:hypothetical protein
LDQVLVDKAIQAIPEITIVDLVEVEQVILVVG